MPAPIQCNVCTQLTLRPIDAREPKNFFTDLTPEDFDGSFEWYPRATRPTLGIQPPSEPPVNSENTKVVTFSDEIISINDNGGTGGFDFQRAIVSGMPRQGAYTVDPRASTGVSATGPKYRIALLSKRRTDILLVDIHQWPDGVFADPTTVEGRAAWFSFAFFLRTAAAAELDIDTQEMDAGFRTLPDAARRPIGQAFLSDKLENGAGYCQWLGEAGNFRRVLQQGDVNYAPGVPPQQSTAAKWMNLTVAFTLSTGCPDQRIELLHSPQPPENLHRGSSVVDCFSYDLCRRNERSHATVPRSHDGRANIESVSLAETSGRLCIAQITEPQAEHG